MANLIDCDKLIAQGWRLERHGVGNELIGIMSLADVPTVDAVPVVHGQWRAMKTYPEFWCSECGELWLDIKSNYCPNCGAKMDGDKDA